MKFLLVLAALCAVALAAPRPEEVEIVRLDQMNNVDGYNFVLETSDGKKHQEEGSVVNAGTDTESIVVRGTYSFVADDGKTYTVNYIADENGFQPQGEHLPVAP